ncbi:hypothetical protein MD484_g8763, partial [Candolleomyces efflorescens]
MAVSSAAASLYDAGRLFNNPPPPGTKSATERGLDTENPLAKPLWLLENTTTSPTVLLADKASLPPFSRYHTENLRERVLALKHLKCLYSDLRDYKGFWFVANSDRFVNIPSQPWRSVDESNPINHRDPQWLDNAAPWMGFSSSYGANEGKALTCIRIPNSSLPYVVEKASEDSYSLNSGLMKEWSDLEEKLARLAPILWEPFEHLPPLHRPQRAKHFGYLDSHTSKAIAIDKIRQSRNAFSRMVTFTSFLLSFWRFSNLEYPFANLAQFLHYRDPELAYFTHELTSTTSAGDFRLGTRNGYIIDLFNYPGDWIPFMHLWVEAGVPLWIFAGPDPLEDAKICKATSPAISEAIKDWMPGQLHITAAFAEYCAQILAQPLPPNSLRRTSVGDSEGFIPELASLGFCSGDYEPGMPPDVYFANKKIALDRWKATRGKAAIVRDPESWMVDEWKPYLDQATMFVWECERGCWARREISSAARKAYFAAHHPRQRYWCPLRSTVELCWSLYPEGGVVDLAVAQEAYDSAGLPALPPLPPLPSPPGSASSASFSHSSSLNPAASFIVQNKSGEEDEEDESDESDCSSRPPAPHHPSASTTITFNPQSLRTWKSSLLDRLGYDVSRPLPDGDSDGGRPVPPKALKPDFWKTAIRCLGTPFSLCGSCSDSEKACIANAVGTLLAHDKAKVFSLGDRWDISTSRGPLRLCPPNLVCHRIVYTSKLGPHRYRFAVALKDRDLKDQWWVLVVSPMAMMQISRTGIDTMLALGRYLIQHGIPFSTAQALSLTKLPAPRPIVRQLEQILSESGFDSDMYTAYKRRCDGFLSSQRGALALKCGGILWRLAIEQVDRSRVKNALFAPSHSARSHGTWCGEWEGVDFVDDCLEGIELDILLGAFRLRKGKEEIAVFVWPTEYAWAASGLNIGEWSSEAEVWYQKRLSDIQSGTAKLFTSNQWAGHMRLLRDSFKIWDTYDSAVNSAYSHFYLTTAAS